MVKGNRKATILEVKHWLKSAEYCQKKIEANLDEIQRLRSLAEKATVSFSSVRASTGRQDRVGDVTVKLVNYQKKLQAQIQKLIDDKERIQFIITNFVDDYSQRIVLEFRYIHLYDWLTISDKMSYSPSHVYLIHNQALQTLADQWPFEPKSLRKENQDANI